MQFKFRILMNNKETNCLNFYNGTQWIDLCTGGPLPFSSSVSQFSSEASAGDQFGYAVSISENGLTYAVSARTLRVAFVYEFIGNTWVETKLEPTGTSGALSTRLFGNAISISADGSTVVVADHWENSVSLNDGAIYVFRKSGNTWSQEQRILSNGIAHDDQFGTSVSISGDGNTIVAGAIGEDFPGHSTGAAYVFKHNGTSWSQTQQFGSLDLQNSDYFGKSVSISDDGSTIAVGAELETAGVQGSGSAYVFRLNTSTNQYVQQAKLIPSNGGHADRFGSAIDISADGNRVIVGSRFNDSPSILGDAGSAYVYSFNDASSTWSQDAILFASDAAAADNFGNSVSISGDGETIAVGAERADLNTTMTTGATYVYKLNGSSWDEFKQWRREDRLYSGFSVNVNGNGSRIITGAPHTSVHGIVDLYY